MNNLKNIFLGIVFWTSIPVHAQVESLPTLNSKQAMLHKQLNFFDQVSDSYGRYIVIRDNDYFGKAGVVETSKGLYKDFDLWLEKWPDFIQRLSFSNEQIIQENIGGSANRKPLQDEFGDLVKSFEKLRIRYALLATKSQEGLLKVKSVPRLDVLDYQNLTEPAVEEVNLVKKKDLGSTVALINKNLNGIERNFKELNTSMQSDFIDNVDNFEHDVMKIIRLKTAIAALQFDTLKAEIANFTKMIETDRALDEVSAKSLSLFEKANSSMAKGDFLATESFLKGLESLLAEDFNSYSDTARYDQERVSSMRKIISLQKDEISRKIKNTVKLNGGRRDAIADFIVTESSSIAKVCRNAKSVGRTAYDCQLFRKMLVPYLVDLRDGTKTDILGEPQLEVLAKILKNVKSGPLSAGNKK